MKSLRVVLCLLLLPTIASAQARNTKTVAVPKREPAPKNVILIIGDGMGPAHFTSMRQSRGADSHLNRLPIIGLATTHCADRAVTDSAAAASALATGEKANYEALSVHPVTGQALPTVLELAERAGRSTGLVTTAAFYDATVAAFAAHVPHRRETALITAQMLSSGIDVLAGTSVAQPPASTGLTTASSPVMLAELAAKEGFTFITTGAGLASASGAKLFAVFPAQPRDVDVPDAPLVVLAQWAIERLRSNPKGFFLVIEHEGTDSSSHQNNSADVTRSLASLDLAIGAAMDFATKAGDTLVVVTADHETGGLRLSETQTSRRMRMEWSTLEHTATAVPVFAFGPGSAAFAGFYDNTDLGKKLLALQK